MSNLRGVISDIWSLVDHCGTTDIDKIRSGYFLPDRSLTVHITHTSGYTHRFTLKQSELYSGMLKEIHTYLNPWIQYKESL